MFAELSGKSRCIAQWVLSESEQKTIRRGALRRAREKVYSGIKRECMRQRIDQVVSSAGLSGGYWRLRGGSGDNEPQRSKYEVLKRKETSEATQEASVEAEGLSRSVYIWFGILWTSVGVFAVRNPFTFIL